MTVGERVRIERKKLGISQEQFDVYVGLSRGHTNTIELRGSTSIETIRTIARRLGIREAYLAFGEEPRQEKETRRRKTA